VITWEDWETKPVTVQMVRFTGFGEHGNGDELLADLNDRGVLADHDPDHPDRIRINTREREEAIVRHGDYVVHGTRDEYYPIEPAVQHDKYRRPA
jgi:hypothetical protein